MFKHKTNADLANLWNKPSAEVKPRVGLHAVYCISPYTICSPIFIVFHGMAYVWYGMVWYSILCPGVGLHAGPDDGAEAHAGLLLLLGVITYIYIYIYIERER